MLNTKLKYVLKILNDVEFVTDIVNNVERPTVHLNILNE